MVIRDCGALSGFEEEMLKNNEIGSLLCFCAVEHNGTLSLWYDITGMRSLKDYILQEGLSVETVYQILLCIGIAFDEIGRYLIGRDQILLDPDTVYIGRSKKSMLVKLCCCPDNDTGFEQGFLAITGFFIKTVDHTVEDVTKLCYALYKRVSEGGFSCQELTEMAAPACPAPEAVEGPAMAAAEQETGLETSDLVESHCTAEEAFRPAAEEDYGLTGPAEDPEAEEEEPSDLRASLRRYIRSFLTGLKEDLQGIFQNRFGVIRRKKDERAEDLVYDPEEDYDEEPTVLLGKEPVQTGGRLVYKGKGAESDYLIDRTRFRIGTAPDCNEAVLHSRAVSRRHALITQKDGTYYIEDLNSTNATFVNDRIVNYHTKVRLAPGDRIRFADVDYCFMG